MLRILIADDHAIIRKGLRHVLIEEYPSALIEEAGDAETIFKKAITSNWNIIICDLNMPGRSGLDVVHTMKQSFPKIPVLVFSLHNEEDYALRVLKAGGAGYLSKMAGNEELVKAVQKVLHGRKYISASIAEKMISELNNTNTDLPHETLSDRELHVFKLIATGKSVSEIGNILSLSTTTVSTYRARILIKMKMKTNAELTRYALENNLVL